MLDFTIRKVTPADAKALLDIYTPYVTDTAITFEYDVPTLEEFTERIQEISSTHPYICAEKDGKILGYAYAHDYRTRAAFKWCAETTIYLDKNARHMGIGKPLYTELEERMKKQGFTNLYAVITSPDTDERYVPADSISFHEKMGYINCAHFTNIGYKFNQWFNMETMEKIIGEHTPDKQPVSQPE